MSTRRRTPRQIAGDVVQDMGRLAERRHLLPIYRPLHEAYVSNKPLPATIDPPQGAEWLVLEYAMRFAFDVRDALRDRDIAAAWRAAAEASYWHGAARGLIEPDFVRSEAAANAGKAPRNVERNERIDAAFSGGKVPKQIAADERLSASQVRRIHNRKK